MKGTRGATLIEILCLLVLALSMICGAFLVSATIDRWYAWILGGLAGFLLFLILLMASAVLNDLWSGWGLPRCRNGCCRGPGYFGGLGDYESEESGGEYLKVCRCGNRYKRQGRRFVSIDDEGTETPYLIWRRFRGWRPDNVKVKEQMRRLGSGT